MLPVSVPAAAVDSKRESTSVIHSRVLVLDDGITLRLAVRNYYRGWLSILVD